MEPIIIDGHYRLERELRHGGHGVIYYGQDIRLGRPVAVKRVLPHMAGPEGNVALLDEARVIARLQHAGITQVHDVREAGDGGIYIIMEYVDGRDLRSIIKDNGPLAPPTAAYIASCVCEALQYAHTAVNPADGTPMEIVHRDITPANIMLTRSGDVKLIDFGIARHTVREQDLTMTGTLKGTVAYMSPEQVRGERDLDGRTDLFSLGAVLFEMLAGKKLFGGSALSDYQQMQMVETVDIDLEERNRTAGITGSMASILATGLQRDRNDRYGDAAVMARELQAMVAGQPVYDLKKCISVLVDEYTEDGPVVPDGTVVLRKTAVLQVPDAPTITMVRGNGDKNDGTFGATPVKPARNNKLLAVLSVITVIIAGGGAFMLPATSEKSEAENKTAPAVSEPVAVPSLYPVHIVSVPPGAGIYSMDGVRLNSDSLRFPIRDTVLLLRKEHYKDLRGSISAAAIQKGAAGPFIMERIHTVRKKVRTVSRKKSTAVNRYVLNVSVKTGAFVPLTGAEVTCKGVTGPAVYKYAGIDGGVSMKLPAGMYVLNVGHRGYRSYEKKITVGERVKPVTVMLYAE